jgi:HD-GYP domain-containing protein (c-di-GMP phosphodiesterase class II)/DNA-binding CsgD family transcriptional regulator
VDATARVSLPQLIGCLALATDLGMGQPLDHGLRTCLLAVGVGRSLGLTEEQLSDVYYIALLRFVGCNAHAHEDRVESGDELAFRAGIAPILSGGPSDYVRFMVKQIGAGLPATTRATMVARALATASRSSQRSVATTCEVAQMIAARLDLAPSVARALGYTFERHDGKGLPSGVEGSEIPITAHVAMIARDFEVLHRLGGRELVMEMARKRRGRAYSPTVLDGFLKHAWPLLEQADASSQWDEFLVADPKKSRPLSEAQLDRALLCLADFADVKTPFGLGYSRAVADLSVRAGHILGLETSQTAVVRVAALLQELGMSGVPNVVLEKPSPLTEGEWERVRLHPYLTERILAPCPALSQYSAVASAHHERIDGHGYHRGLTGSQLTVMARLLAAAGAYVALVSERPWRPPMSSRAAAGALREEVGDGRFDPAATDAVLAAAGEKVPSHRRTWPAGLTDREVEVLRLIARGKSNRVVAAELVISPKTVGRHIENLYSKIGISSRAAAAVFAVQHELVAPLEPSKDG